MYEKWPNVYDELKYLAIIAMYGVSEKETIFLLILSQPDYHAVFKQLILCTTVRHSYTCCMITRSTRDLCFLRGFGSRDPRVFSTKSNWSFVVTNSDLVLLNNIFTSSITS